MLEPDWQGLLDARFEKNATILELVESLADESLSLNERRQLRDKYRSRYGVFGRTIRNYIARYRQGGAQAFPTPIVRTPPQREFTTGSSPRPSSPSSRNGPSAVPKLRKLLAVDTRFALSVEKVSHRSIYRFLLEHGLSHKARYALLSEDGRMSYNRFQAAPPDLVQGDARDGIWLDTKDGKRKTYLFFWIDDYSRKILSGRYYFDEKLPRMEDTFKRLVLRWGIPLKVYLDNGSVYIAKQFAWVLAQLKTAKLHHKPYQAYTAKARSKPSTKPSRMTSSLARRIQDPRRAQLRLRGLGRPRVQDPHPFANRRGSRQAFRRCAPYGYPYGARRRHSLVRSPLPHARQPYRHQVRQDQARVQQIPRHLRAARLLVEARYDPFDLFRIFIFKEGSCAETTYVSKLVNRTAAVSQESKVAPPEVSAHASNYFQMLREQHARMLTENLAPVSYSKLSPKDAQ